MTFTSKVSKGSAGELLAAVWFAERGFHVYRSISHAAPIDLIVYKERMCFRIEVKTARWSKRGWKYGEVKHPTEVDGLIVVYPNGALELKPSPWQVLENTRLLSIRDTGELMKCKHGMPSPDQCAICKDWPSYEKMHNLFPSLSTEIFLVMTPAQRIEAVKTGVLNQ